MSWGRPNWPPKDYSATRSRVRVFRRQSLVPYGHKLLFLFGAQIYYDDKWDRVLWCAEFCLQMITDRGSLKI